MATQREKIILEGEDKTRAAMTSAETGFNRFSETVKKAALAGGIAIGVAALARLGKEAVTAAVNAEEAASAFTTSFGPATGRVSDFVEDFAHKAGFANYELQQMLAITGSVVQGLGATEDESADLSIRMATLAGDVASFSNAAGGAPAVLAALQSAINGEREALKTYGIAVTEVEVQQRALMDTGKTHAEDLTKLEKALATVEIAYSKASKAVGDLDRTQDSTANSLRRANAGWKEAQVQIGEALIPAIAALIPIFETVVPLAADLLAPAFEAVSGAVKILAPALGLVADALGDIPSPMVLAGAAVALFALKAGGLGALVDGLRLRFMYLGDFLRGGGISGAFSKLAGAINPVVLGITAAIAMFTVWNRRKQEAQQLSDDLRGTLDAETGAITENTRAYVVNRLEKEGLLELLARAKISAGTYIAAVEGDTAATHTLESALIAAQAAGELSNSELLKLTVGYHDLSGGLSAAEESLARTNQATREAGAAAEEYDRNLGSLIADHDRLTAARAAGDTQADHSTDAEGGLKHGMDLTAKATLSVLQATEDLADERLKALDPIYNLRAAEADVADAVATLSRLETEGKTATSEYEDAQWDLIKAHAEETAAAAAVGLATGETIAMFIRTAREAGLTEESIRGLIGGMSGLTDESVDLGYTLANGVVSGLYGLAGKLQNRLVGEIRTAIAGSRFSLGIASPSKITAQEIGVPLGEGIAEGLASTEGIISGTLAGIVNAAIAAAAATAGNAAATLGAAAQAAGITDASQLSEYLGSLHANSFRNLTALAESQGIDIDQNQIRALRSMGYTNVRQVVEALGITDIGRALSGFGVGGIPAFAGGGYLGPGEWGIAGEAGAEMLRARPGGGVDILPGQRPSSGQPLQILVDLPVKIDGREIARVAGLYMVDDLLDHVGGYHRN